MATVTITVGNADAQRVADAVGNYTNEDQSAASNAQVKTWLIDQLKAVVRTYEREVAAEAARAAATDLGDTT